MSPTKAPTNETVSEKLAEKVLDNLVKQDDVNLSKAGKADIQAEVVKQTSQVIMNQSNSEPWYLSTVTWGAVLTVIFSLLEVLGYSIAEEDKSALISNVTEIIKAIGPILTAITGVIVWWGRWRAKRGLTVLSGTGTGDGTGK